MQTLTILALALMLPIRVYAINVFACEPEWGALVAELAGDRAEITVALTAFQDPHRLQARPSLIAATRRAQLVVCTGADLEAGWLPLLIRRASNPTIRRGTNGHFLAADFVRKLEVPSQLDRSQGDIHPQGNPHIHLNPRNISRVAVALSERLSTLDPANAQVYETRLAGFIRRWEAAIQKWEMRGRALAAMPLVPNHRSFSYLADWLDLNVITTVEAKPGIPPSGAHLSRLLEQLATNPPDAVVRTPYGNEKQTRWLAERLEVPEIVLPYTVGGHAEATDLFGLFEATLLMLEEVGS